MGRATYLFIAGVIGCGADVTEVVVVVDADPAVSERARSLAVRIYDTEGENVVDRVDSLPAEVMFPVRIPLTPRGGSTGRSYRVEIEARTAFGCVFSSATVMGGYEAGVAIERGVTLTPTAGDPCPLGPGCMGDCDDGLACTTDSCVEERCLNEVATGQCAIDGACHGVSNASPEDPCRACLPTISQTAWSLAAGCDVAEVARFDEGAAGGGRYGEAVAIDGRHAVIGAPEANGDTGQAFAFRLDDDGAWAFDGELVPRDRAAGDFFGRDVDLAGDWAVVGAPNAGTAGRAFLFRRDPNSGWVADQELTSASLAPSDRFGASVAIDGDLALVGATHREAPLGESGAVFVYRRSPDGRWAELALVSPPDPQREAFFGNAVALDGNRFVVGSVYFDAGPTGELTSAGAAYVFEISGDVVGPAIELLPETVEASIFFGDEVSIGGTRVGVAATQDNTFGNDAGAVHVFEIADGAATRIGTIGMGPAGAQAGRGLAVGPRFVAVGFPFNVSGFVTLFEEGGGRFSGLPRLAPDGLSPGSAFGRGIATSDRFLVVGAPEAAEGSTPGAVYFFELRQ
jgi:hypothetical protein